MVLRVRAFGESDKIVTFLTRDFGKLSGIAKGAAKSRRRFVGSLEPFTHVDLRFRARTQSDLCFVESADIVRAARRITLDLDRYAYSTYVVELIDAMVEGREAEPGVFDLAEETLAGIDSSATAPSAERLRRFEIRLLKLAGFEPKLDRCVRCGRLPDGAVDFYFNARTGTLLCETCSDRSGVRVSTNALHYLADLSTGSIGSIKGVSSSSAGEARILLHTFIAHHVRRPLRSPALLREILNA